MEQESPRFPQLAKEALLNSKLKPQFQNRARAKIIDMMLVQGSVWVFYWLHPLLGVLVALGSWTLADCIGRGQSPGKWLLGLHTIDQKRASRPGFYQSFVRNIPFIVLSIAMAHHTPILKALSIVSLLWIAIEIYFVRHIRSGLRVGDVLGGTRVFEYKDEHTKFIEQLLKEEENI